MPPSKERAAEPTMNTTLTQRTLSLTLSLLVTAALFGAVDLLAGSQPSSAVWASAVSTARG